MILSSPSFHQNEISVMTPSEVVERSPQKIGAAEVDGAYLQKVYNRQGDLLFVHGEYFDGLQEQLKTRAEKLDVQKYAFVELLKKQDDDLRNASHIFEPRVIVAPAATGTRLMYAIDYINQTGTAAYRTKVAPNGEITSKEVVGSMFEQGKAIIFPSGPKFSELQEVLLGGLIGDGTLTKPTLKVLTQLSEKAMSPDDFFKYDPQDVRFDQVQTFYYVDKALKFFQISMGITLPFSLEVQTHVGAPDRTNAAFYYHGQIRLGTGDGVDYDGMMKDPSIVIHESCHALIDALARLPSSGEGGSINEGFADFITAVILNNPKMAESSYIKGPYKRTVANAMKVSQKSGKLYPDSGIISGTFWEIHESIGDRLSLNLVVKTLSRLGPGGNFASFPVAVENALGSGFSEAEKKSVMDIMKKREWL